MTTNKPSLYIVDIDGTVATHFDADGKQLREHYDYTKVAHDLPNLPIIEVVHALQRHHTTLYVSGREDSCRDDTVKWLKKYKIAPPIPSAKWLFMRRTGDYRPDFMIKEEIYHEHIEPFYDVVACFDDRQQIVDMWRSLGLTCLQVAKGDF